MTFLEPLLLWGLPLAALPIVIHLLNLRRHRKVEWGAMQFILQATRQRRGHTRLRHLLILLARAFAVAAMIFVISRPMAGRWFGLFGGRPETVIVVLDRSASMSQQDIQSGRSKRDMALSQITTAIQRAGAPRNLVLIENQSSQPHVLGSPESLLEVPEVGATDAASNLPSMLETALDYVVANKSGRTDVWVCSDLRANDWNAEGGQWEGIRAGFEELKQPVRFHLLAYDQVATDNVAVRILKLSRRQGRDTDQLVFELEVRRQSASETVTIPVAIVVDNARSVIDVELTGDVATVSDYTVPIDKQRKQGWGKVELPNDSNPRDNVFFFAYGDMLKRKALVVTNEPGSAWPLRLAAAPAPDDTTAAQVLSPSDLVDIDWQSISLVLWQAPLPAGAERDALRRFVDSGGQVVFFPPLDANDQEAWGYRWAAWEQLTPDATDPATSQAVDQWRDDSGLLAHVDSGDPLPVNRITVREYRKMTGDGQGQVLARIRTGDPLLLRIPTDRGGVFFLTSLPQEPYSNFARQGIVFFAMIQRALQDGAERLTENQFGLIRTAQSSEETTQWQRIDGWPEGGLSTQQRHVAGVYQAGEQFLARNRPPEEDSTGTLSSEQLEQLMGGLNYRVVRDTVQGGKSLVAEIWRGFVVLMLLALIAESGLCLPDVRPRKRVVE